MKIQIGEIFVGLKNQLCAKFGPDTASTLSFIIVEHIYGLSRTEVIVYGKREVEQDISTEDNFVDKLLNDMPIDYIIGEREFYGREFYVTPSVLTPRPETEELVRLISDDFKGKTSSVIDIGTGSGVIALTLALELPMAQVYGLDVSCEALEVAEKNRVRHNIHNVKFINNDILALDSLPAKYDIIVSNPPYVLDSEKELMSKNVLDYEPHLALFVEDNNPLVFYEKIADLALTSLNLGGVLYFEINENKSQEMEDMLASKGFHNIKVIDDIFDKPRIIKAEL